MECYTTPIRGKYLFFLYRPILHPYWSKCPVCTSDKGGRQRKGIYTNQGAVYQVCKEIIYIFLFFLYPSRLLFISQQKDFESFELLLKHSFQNISKSTAPFRVRSSSREIIFFQQGNIQFRGIFWVKTLFQKLWPLLYKRAELDLRSTNGFKFYFRVWPKQLFISVIPNHCIGTAHFYPRVSQVLPKKSIYTTS